MTEISVSVTTDLEKTSFPVSRFNDSDHLKDPDLYSDKSDREGEQDHEESDPEGLEKSEESDSDMSERQDDSYVDLDPNEHLRETPYLEQSHEELGEVGGEARESNQSIKKSVKIVYHTSQKYP